MTVPNFVKKISDTEWEIPASYKKGMLVPSRFIATENIVADMDSQVFEQVTNVATLPGIINYAYCMPDGHSGYGFPIGGVAAFDTEKGVISPGGIGFDINCGMRLVSTNLTYNDIKPKLRELVDLLFKRVPAGVGSEGFVKLNANQFKEAITSGAKWAIEQGYGWEEDLERIEENGCVDGDVTKVSDRAIKRGINQIGTLGSGNHYLEIQVAKPENIFDKDIAKVYGINRDNQVVVMFHCLPGDARVLTEYGCWVPINKLDTTNMKVKCFDPQSHDVLDTEIEKFYKVKGKEKLFKIKTKSGKELVATEDHPVLTTEGLKLVTEINVGERLAILPFDGVEYEEPSDEIIVSEKDIRKLHDSDKIVEDLKTRGLLPLRMNSSQLPIIAKLLGYITGDGNVRKSGRGWRIHIGNKEDLSKISEDARKLGFKFSNIVERESGGLIESSSGNKLKIKGKSNIMTCNSSALALLFISLSVPLGKKTAKEFEVPVWVSKSPKWIARLYLAGYFGAELTKPILTMSGNKYQYFERPTLAVYKVEKLKENGIKFLSQICQLLKKFDIESKVTEENNAGRVTKAGNTIKLLLRISSVIENLIKFYSEINYEYCNRKTIESNYVLQYLNFKQKLWNKTAASLKVNSKSIKYKPYQYDFKCQNFEQFVINNKLNPPTPIIWDEIESVEKIENNEEFVYDIRVKNKNHNFVADNFVVGNCGSRGFGHQTATDYLQTFLNVMERKYGIKILDRELACAPFQSKEGQDYFAAMKCGLNMSFANRQVILHRIRECFEKVLGQKAEDMDMRCVYDVAHNTAKLEKHNIDGKQREVLVHRKGATRAFGPGREEVPSFYRHVGQPVIIGGSMETGSYLLAGTDGAMQKTFGSTCHGAGRTMSRTRAKQLFRGDKLLKDMEQRGILVRSVSMPGLAEEAGDAYKNIDTVIDAVHEAGISKKVVKLVPVGNVKG